MAVSAIRTNQLCWSMSARKRKKREVIDMYMIQLTTSGKPPDYFTMLMWFSCAEMLSIQP